MKITKKAARIGGDQLINSIAAASTSAKARIQHLDHQDIEGVAGGNFVADIAKAASAAGSAADVATEGLVATIPDPFSDGGN